MQGAWKSPFRPLVQAGIRPAGADGAAGKPALPVLYTDSTGCASCREDIFAKAKDVFSCKMTRFKANKTAARAGGPPLLPFRAGRVNDKKVNEDNSDSGTGRRARLCRGADSLPCIQVAPVGIQDTTFHMQLQVVSPQKGEIKYVPAYFRESAQRKTMPGAINTQVARETVLVSRTFGNLRRGSGFTFRRGYVMINRYVLHPQEGICPVLRGRRSRGESQISWNRLWRAKPPKF